MLIEGLNKKVRIDNVLRLPETIRDRGFCESQALQILLFQFDSGRGLHANSQQSCKIFSYFQLVHLKCKKYHHFSL